jgi:hypothetical protein
MTNRFTAYARDKEGSWFYQGAWPMTALEPGHTDHPTFRKVLDTYPEVVCYPVYPGVTRQPFARFIDAEENTR